MSTLRAYCLRLSLLAAALILVVAMAAGIVRLLPWVLAPEVPLEISAPFAVALAAVATEAAVLVALPVGFALGATMFVERGEARALFALGCSPARLVGAVVPVAGALAALAFMMIAAWDVETSAPGRFASQLIAQGRASCERADEPRGALVPLVGVTWLCFPERTPRVAGPLPRSGGRAWFTATDLAPSDDLRRFQLRDLELMLKLNSTLLPRVRLRVQSAVVTGLTPWGRPARLGAARRAGLIASTAALLGLAVTGLLLRERGFGRIGACAVSGAGALSALSLLRTADAAADRPGLYLLVPFAALIITAGCALLWLGCRHFWQRLGRGRRVAWRSRG